MSTASRRTTRRHPTPPPPPSPKVLHFPLSRRTRRKQTKPANSDPLLLLTHYRKQKSHTGKLDSLFDQECNGRGSHLNPPPSSKSSSAERRERVEENDAGAYFHGGGIDEEKWRFQAEILRAECRLLRMERERALKKLQKNRVKMERTLTSAVQTLASGRKKISEGKNVDIVLEEEIEDLEEKLEELQKGSRTKDFEIGNCSLRRTLESNIVVSDCGMDPNVDMVRKRMVEGVGKVQNSNNISTSFSTSASSSKRIECPELSNEFGTRQSHQEEPMMEHENKCSGRCKAIVRRVMEQVRAETEQWSQMQEMLAQVRGEMEELQASRDFWENRAYNSDCEIQSLRHAVEEWKEKALRCENKANELQLKVSVLTEENQKSKSVSPNPVAVVPLRKQLEKEKLVLSLRSKKNYSTDVEEEHKERKTPKKDYFLQPLSLGKQLAKEKRMILRRLKDARHHGSSSKGGEVISPDGQRKKSYSTVGILDPFRSPLKDVNNLSPLTRQSSRSTFGFFNSPESSRIREGFKKVISLNYA